MTVEEALKRVKMCIGISPSENIVESHKLISDAIDELKQYRAIGTVSEFRELKEKATAKKPIDHFDFSPCPKCGSTETLGDGFLLCLRNRALIGAKERSDTMADLIKREALSDLKFSSAMHDDEGIVYVPLKEVRQQINDAPQVPIPEKKEPDSGSDSVYFEALGWNDCIDAICGEE